MAAAAFPLLCLSFSHAGAVDAPLLADAYTFPGNIGAVDASTGASPGLNVGNGSVAYLRFNMATLPSGITRANVAKATLTVWVSKRTSATSALAVQAVTGAWQEDTLTLGDPIPALGTQLIATALVPAAGSYVSFDISELAKSWVDFPEQNFGLGITSVRSQPSITFVIDSKENTLTGHAARLDITLMTEGKPGAVGATGPDGAVGLPGVAGGKGGKGDPGAAGMVGAKGDKGDTGDAGAQGAIGLIGAKGDKGDIGDAGASGAAGVKGDKGDAGTPGAQGAAGIKGDKGDAGAAGAQGIAGVKGAQGDAGAAGAQGAAGPKGDVGAQGAQGVAGVKGNPGAAGATGATGPTGSAGPQGAAGIAGAGGIQGPKGNTGDTGAGGAQGPAGAAGAAGGVAAGVLVDVKGVCAQNSCAAVCPSSAPQAVSGTCSFEAIGGPENNFPLTWMGVVRRGALGDSYSCNYAAPGPISVGKKVLSQVACTSK
ncbi:DNRLRE domain-containing protein [Duganella sp. S19_KUP01_CR8]|uniref:DNRLRE domain-containing protein n=1 Tax=Duganella sp. S19_KUP01_CR8 TaxID=3025502 RepID=UPI002FCD768E